MKLEQLIFIIIILSCTLSGQHYITSGIGVTGSSVSSDKMDNFKKTYNQANSLVLTEKIDGFDLGLGIRPEFGYRYINKYSTAFLIGYQTITDFDVANFSNGDSRKFKMDLSAYFLEFELGYNWGDFFTNGLIAYYFNRQIQIKNTYNTSDPDLISSFTGTFKGNSFNSADIGVAIGFVKEFYFIIFKISYPFYTGGNSNVLTDSKQEEAFKRFPADYFSYIQNDPYQGVSSDIDGIKLILTFSYAFNLNTN